jgi:3-deoxy-7-phosphoheptulonate synthase
VITRLGASQVDGRLPALIRAVPVPHSVVWMCDPMHGNTMKAENGMKTREFALIVEEITRSFAIHEDAGSFLAGFHFELTGENVTECVGGVGGVAHGDLPTNYTSSCDPRLNHSQSLEMAFVLAGLLEQSHT